MKRRLLILSLLVTALIIASMSIVHGTGEIGLLTDITVGKTVFVELFQQPAFAFVFESCHPFYYKKFLHFLAQKAFPLVSIHGTNPPGL